MTSNLSFEGLYKHLKTEFQTPRRYVRLIYLQYFSKVERYPSYVIMLCES